jgi:hypothetical protein
MRTRTTTAIAVSAAAACAATAGPVTFEYDSIGRAEIVNIAVGDDFSGRVYAGSIVHHVDDVEMHTFCIDPEQLSQSGVANFERVRLGNALKHRSQGVARSVVLAELADIAGETIWTSSSPKINAAAFQVAAWEVVSDYDASQGAASFDLAGGRFTSWGNDAVMSAAADLLGLLTFGRADASGYDAFLHDSHQDFMGRTVPAPGAIAVAIASVPLLARRRRG